MNPSTASKPSDALRKRRRDPVARPQQILDAAFEEFAMNGLAGARLDDIARRANVAKGTIYLYFPTKETLFRELVRSSTSAALENAETQLETAEGDSATSQLRFVASGWWGLLRTERFEVVHRLVLSELHQFPDLMQFYADEVIARGRRLVSRIVARGIASGEFRAIDPEVAARMLSALAMTHSSWCSRRQFHPGLAQCTDDEVRDEIIEFYLHALRPEPARPSVTPSHSAL